MGLFKIKEVILQPEVGALLAIQLDTTRIGNLKFVLPSAFPTTDELDWQGDFEENDDNGGPTPTK